jgi:phosphate/sulfate permease
MKKRIAAVMLAAVHNHSVAALATATSAGVSVGIFTTLLGLRPEIWACATFGAAYAYMLRKDAPRNRLLNMVFSIVIAVFGSDAAAEYLVNTHKIDSIFLTPLIALLIAAAFPWLFEKYVVKRK